MLSFFSYGVFVQRMYVCCVRLFCSVSVREREREKSGDGSGMQEVRS